MVVHCGFGVALTVVEGCGGEVDEMKSNCD